ncbi:MAG: Rsd/AlgQ family anti-sigma factor [Gammaproteobacteria bacterium]|nr:Rsd/AlgQ family anti-sigma factor [Gammaproteobacteria bacterium]MCZ6853134.1 Rsd/AlgQ family anti-sigma factor [Gammaproteobacteria bacterium]
MSNPTMATATTAKYDRDATANFTTCRQRLITYLVELNNALDAGLEDLSQAILTRFCNSLVDYLSAGHFQVFQRLIPAPHEYAAIESTTLVAMRFNDEFGDLESVNIAQVKAALEQLALVLGTRFELEDDILLSSRG